MIKMTLLLKNYINTEVGTKTIPSTKSLLNKDTDDTSSLPPKNVLSTKLLPNKNNNEKDLISIPNFEENGECYSPENDNNVLEKHSISMDIYKINIINSSNINYSKIQH